MAKPPLFANGIPGNDSQYAPELWTDVQPSQNETISRNDMVYTSTVEYKGYYKAQSTGFHKFQLTGGADGFAWVSSANTNSDHIDVQDDIEVVTDKSYGIRIPAKPAGASYWRFEDMNTLGGTFPGYGYWPLQGYGNSTKWVAYFSGRGISYNHGSFFPGDIRTYGATSKTTYGSCVTYCEGTKAGPGWSNPEDNNWNTSDLKYPCDDDWTNSSDCRQEARGAQVFISEAYVAGGSDKRGLWESVENQEPYIIWPVTQSVPVSGQQKPERVQILQTIKIKRPGKFKFKFTTRYGIKIWYTETPYAQTGIGPIGGAATLRRLDPQSGNNPIASGGGSFVSDEFTTSGVNTRIAFAGSVTGNQATGDIGYGIQILDAENNDEVIWDSSKLVADSNGLVGISECGYHALLEAEDRIPTNGISEFYKADGWLGYGGGGLNYNADLEVGDDVDRSERDTRQYLWENVTSLLYDEQSRPGFVYLRQDDFYFVRVIVSNKETGTGQGFAFQVTDPGSNSLQQVTFSGNGDPNADSTVGGGVGGSGIPISKDALCNSVLYAGNIPNTSTTFGIITQTGGVLNLTALGVPEAMLGTEGQSESITGENPDVPPGDSGIDSYLVNVGGTKIKLAVLLQGGENGIPPMTPDEKSAVRTVVKAQADQSLTLSIGEFRNAITSQAVIAYGSSGNYRYLYHAVGEVVQSICDDNFTLGPPTSNNGGGAGGGAGGGGNNGGGGDNGDGECVDLNLSGLTQNQGLVSISSTCVDDCKPYADYAPPTGFASGAPSNINYIGTLGNGGRYIPADYLEKPGKEYIEWVDFGPGGRDQVDVRFGRNISCWGLWTPDILPSSTVTEAEQRATGIQGVFNGILNMYTISFVNGQGTDPNENIDPLLYIWVSAEPGGPALGGSKQTLVYAPSTTNDIDVLKVGFTMEPVYLNTDKLGRTGVLYIGNTSGKRYLNMAPIKNANWAIDPTKSYSEPGNRKPDDQILNPGDAGFENQITTKDTYTKLYGINLVPPDQKCDPDFEDSRIISGAPPSSGGDPHDGSGLPSYVDYNPEDDFFYGREGFAVSTDQNNRKPWGQLYFEPCTIRSVPILIIPGQSHGIISGVPRLGGAVQSRGQLTGRSCPSSTQYNDVWVGDGAFFQPLGYTYQWLSRVPGEWTLDSEVISTGGNVEYWYRMGDPDDLKIYPYPFNVTEPTWIYFNIGSPKMDLRPNPPDYNMSKAPQKFIVPDYNNLWPELGWYWVQPINSNR